MAYDFFLRLCQISGSGGFYFLHELSSPVTCADPCDSLPRS